MSAVRKVTWYEVQSVAHVTATHWRPRRSTIAGVYGVPRGGIVPAALVAAELELPIVDDFGPDHLVVDDLVDSGATLLDLEARGARHLAPLFRKSWSPARFEAYVFENDPWLAFPWEGAEGAAGPEDAVVRLLSFVGEDPGRDGLVDTPRRVVGALGEMTSGYAENPAEILGRTFAVDCDEMVVVRGIDFVSLCEHHVLPFTGTVDVAYIPGPRVLGLSKIARLVDCFARRLQVQERLTQQIATAIDTHVDARGVGVVVRARHHCMGCRGVRKPGAEMVTSALFGLMKDDEKARAEFLALAHHA